MSRYNTYLLLTLNDLEQSFSIRAYTVDYMPRTDYFRSTSVFSALEVFFTRMRYINLLLTFDI